MAANTEHFIIFIVSGFWHGANWTFIIWGMLHAIYFLPLLLTKNNRNHLDIVAQGRNYPSAKEFLSMSVTFGLTVFAWIFFRADSVGHAINYIGEIFSASFFTMPIFTSKVDLFSTIFYILIMLFLEWKSRELPHALENLGLNWRRPVRLCMYYGIIILIFWFGGKEQQFIYFQF